MLLAIGDFHTPTLGFAAQAMAEGRRATADAKVTRHPDGWGLFHQSAAGGAPVVRKEERPFNEVDVGNWMALGKGITLIHARHATRRETLGLDFTHPLIRDGLVFCHNGYTPNAAAFLGLADGEFDSRALFDVLAPPGTGLPSEPQVRKRLMAIGQGGSSANAFLVSRTSALVINWFEGDSHFYTLWSMRDHRGVVFASEPLLEIAPAQCWRPLGHGKVVFIKLEGAVQ